MSLTAAMKSNGIQVQMVHLSTLYASKARQSKHFKNRVLTIVVSATTCSGRKTMVAMFRKNDSGCIDGSSPWSLVVLTVVCVETGEATQRDAAVIVQNGQRVCVDRFRMMNFSESGSEGFQWTMMPTSPNRMKENHRTTERPMLHFRARCCVVFCVAVLRCRATWDSS